MALDRSFRYFKRTVLYSTSPTDHHSAASYNKVVCFFTGSGNDFYCVEDYGGWALKKSTDAGINWSTIYTSSFLSSSGYVYGADRDITGSIYIAYKANSNFYIDKSLDDGATFYNVFTKNGTENYTPNVAKRNFYKQLSIGKTANMRSHVHAIFESGAAGTNNNLQWVYSLLNGEANTWFSGSLSSDSYGPSGSVLFKGSEESGCPHSIVCTPNNYGSQVFIIGNRRSGASAKFVPGIVSSSYKSGDSGYGAAGNLFVRIDDLHTYTNPGGPYDIVFEDRGVNFNVAYLSHSSTSLFFGNTNIVCVLTRSRLSPDEGFSASYIVSMTASSGIDTDIYSLSDFTGSMFLNFLSTSFGSTDYVVRKSITSGSSFYDWSFGERIRIYNASTFDGILNKPEIILNEDKSDRSILYKLSETVLSFSLGPSTLATSISYPVEFEGLPYQRYVLANVAEFPYSEGIFQMPFLVRGTTDSGQAGSDEDSIIQVKHFGSVVHIMWPLQSKTSIPTKGFGDLTAGQKIGILTTSFVNGAPINVEKYDHVTLYCYCLKGVLGTSDDIEVRVKRRPLKSVGFAPDQVIEYGTSGSFAIADLKDLVYKKTIDYSDLSMREISFPIDIPLTNTKEIQIEARQVNGQSDNANKNLIIWGRFIKSTEET